ncbi:hypothetical protein HQ447_11565 [bacterium]|nr:hypothetical protein [bacterium]
MEYYHQEKFKITADLALRIGRIAQQYEDFRMPPDRDYEVTLNLCLLQTLLTQCNELMRKMGRRGGPDLGLHVPIDQSGWGLEEVVPEPDDFEGPLTVARFLKHLRNAMCHPTDFNPNARIPSSGYTSVPDGSGMLRKVVFCDSPGSVGGSQMSGSSARVFLVALTTFQLKALVLNLANLLAQPAREYWDGKSVINLIAA